MQINHIHSWKVSYKEAIIIQKQLRQKIVLKPNPSPIRLVAGADISVSKKSTRAWAGVVVLGFPELEELEWKWDSDEIDFPYIPGLLSFREIPLLLKVFEKLELDPDLILCDGQGIAHPRGLGLASHLGLFLNKPTIGCAKSRLVGEYHEVGQQKGNHSPLVVNGNTVGAVVRTRENVKPLFISPGHLITIKQSIQLALSCTKSYRIPEPVRRAHLLVNRLRKNQEDA